METGCNNDAREAQAAGGRAVVYYQSHRYRTYHIVLYHATLYTITT